MQQLEIMYWLENNINLDSLHFLLIGFDPKI